MPPPRYIYTYSNILSTFRLLTSGYYTGLLGLGLRVKQSYNQMPGFRLAAQVGLRRTQESLADQE